jgi:hypothetical protein
MQITREQIRAARALLRLEQAELAGHALYEELRAISLRSAARLQDRALLTDADLYDENGLPA